MGYNLNGTSLTVAQRSDLLARILLEIPHHYLSFPYIHTHMQLSEAATVLGQLPDCLLGDCSTGYVYLPQLSAVRCQCQHTLLCHHTAVIQADLLQVRAAACQLY